MVSHFSLLVRICSKCSFFDVACETEVGYVAVNLAHECDALEEEVCKANQAADLEKENKFLNEELTEKRRLKDGAISNVQFAMKKTSKFSKELVEFHEGQKVSLESARNSQKRETTLAKEKSMTLQR